MVGLGEKINAKIAAIGVKMPAIAVRIPGKVFQNDLFSPTIVGSLSLIYITNKSNRLYNCKIL